MALTGFLPSGAHWELSVIVMTANALERDDVISHLPVSYEGLAAAGRGELVAAVIRSRHPLALSLAPKSDPASRTSAGGVRSVWLGLERG